MNDIVSKRKRKSGSVKSYQGRIQRSNGKMLDYEVVKEFLEEKLEGIEIPDDVVLKDLMETFCRYVEDDYYEWLNDNFKSFFDHWKPNWNWIRDRIGDYSKS